MILIVSEREDRHAQLVARRLAEKGAAVGWFEVVRFPATTRLSAWFDSDSPARVVARAEGGEAIEITRARSVWFRRRAAAEGDPSLSEQDRAFARNESQALLYGLGAMLADRFCVNPLVHALANNAGNGKAAQLEIARAHGLTIPRTLATSDPDDARAFLASCAGGAIYKPFLSPIHNVAKEGEPAKWAAIFTSEVDAESWGDLDGVTQAPCIFQERIPKQVDVRVTVIGTRVFASAIHSQDRAESALDFRRHYALGETRYDAHELPRAIQDRILAVNRALGLVFGAYDFVLTPDGRYVFLEVNQQGQFLWLEEQTGQPLLEHFCEMLIQARVDYACDAEPHAPGSFLP